MTKEQFKCIKPFTSYTSKQGKQLKKAEFEHPKTQQRVLVFRNKDNSQDVKEGELWELEKKGDYYQIVSKVVSSDPDAYKKELQQKKRGMAYCYRLLAKEFEGEDLPEHVIANMAIAVFNSVK